MGAGFNVHWDKVPEYMHLESCLKKQETPAPVRRYRSLSIDERELEAIMEREFGPIKRPEYRAPAVNSAPARPIVPPKKQYIIVDGYNFIFASQELSALAPGKAWPCARTADGYAVELLRLYKTRAGAGV